MSTKKNEVAIVETQQDLELIDRAVNSYLDTMKSQVETCIAVADACTNCSHGNQKYVEETLSDIIGIEQSTVRNMKRVGIGYITLESVNGKILSPTQMKNVIAIEDYHTLSEEDIVKLSGMTCKEIDAYRKSLVSKDSDAESEDTADDSENDIDSDSEEVEVEVDTPSGKDSVIKAVAEIPERIKEIGKAYDIDKADMDYLMWVVSLIE